MPDFRYQYQPKKKPTASKKEQFARVADKFKLPRPLRDRGVLLIAGVWFLAIVYVVTTGITGYLTTTSNLTYQLNETSAELSKLEVTHSELASQYDACLSDLSTCKDSESSCEIDLSTCKKYRQSLEEQISNISALEVKNAELKNELNKSNNERVNLIKSYVQTVCCLQQKANENIRYYQVIDGWISCSADKGTEFSC